MECHFLPQNIESAVAEAVHLEEDRPTMVAVANQNEQRSVAEPEQVSIVLI